MVESDENIIKKIVDYLFAFSLGCAGICPAGFNERTHVFGDWGRRPDKFAGDH